MHVTRDWQDASGGYQILRIAGHDHPRLGGGKAGNPARLRYRVAATRPVPGDADKLFLVEGRKIRHVQVPDGHRLWLRSEVTQMVLDIEQLQITDLEYQPNDDTLTGLAGLPTTPGLVEQTAADVFAIRALGVAAGTSVPTRADGDLRWAPAGKVADPDDFGSLAAGARFAAAFELAQAEGIPLVYSGAHVHDSALEGLLWTRPCKILGPGMFSGGIQFTALPDSVSALTINPTVTGESLFGWLIEGVRLKKTGSGVGRYGVSIALDDTPSEFLAKFTMQNCWIGPFNERALSFTKGADGGTPANTNALFTSNIDNNRFDGGPDADHVVHLDNFGDSGLLRGNTATGTGIGLYLRPVSGAVRQAIEDWNITATGGAVYLKNSGQAIIRGGQFEQSSAYTGADNAQIVLDNTSDCTIEGLNLNAYDEVDNILFKSGATRNRVRHCTMRVSTAATKYNFNFASTASGRNDHGAWQNTYILHEGGLSAQARVSDSSTAIQNNIWYEQTLLNGWVEDADANYDQGLFAMLLPDGTVMLKGNIEGGTNVAGTTIATLPVEMRPLLKSRHPTVTYVNATEHEVRTLNMLIGGNLQIGSQVFGATTLVNFETEFNIYS